MISNYNRMLHLIVGPMYSGKTTEEVRLLQIKPANVKAIFINSVKDTRTDNVLFARNNVAKESDFVGTIFTKVEKLTELDVSTYDMIFVDEAQFFEDLVPFVVAAIEIGKKIIVAGLNGDFMARPFGYIHELLSHATKITLLAGGCACGGDAIYSCRKGGNPGLILVDDSAYVSVCYACRKKIMEGNKC
jgi:thymidine kinase